jgi:hypothetical protein
MDGQTERVNQIMEDMLRACVLTYGKDWEQSLLYVEFSYNNGYQVSLGMLPFEALLLTVQNRAQVHRKPTGDLVPFSPRRVLPIFVNPRIGSKSLRFSI